jgi:acyl dehydratase
MSSLTATSCFFASTFRIFALKYQKIPHGTAGGVHDARRYGRRGVRLGQSMIFLEDIAVGQVASFGSYRVTREEVIDFASRYDPQPFHLDDSAAAANPIFGRLSASGWHSAAMAMRMIVDNGRAMEMQMLGSPGVDELRWITPVYPGDTLRAESEVIEARPSKSRPRTGILRNRITLFNQHDEQVMTMITIAIIQRRD